MARIQIQSNTNRKEIILNSAAYLFRKKGFKATTVRELAETLNIEAPSLYNHFISKSELLRQICFAVAADFTKHLTELKNTDLPEIKKIDLLIRFHIKKMYSDFDNVYVANHEWKHLPKNELQIFLNQRKEYEQQMIDIIKEGIKNNELKGMHPQVTVLTILSAVRGLEFWQRHKKEMSITELENNMVNHLLNGITK
jgi:TetR/AcrR family transcriptional regulator, cholesterol catabolism regulator